MSFNSFGHLFRFTTWGESHGPAIGCVVDGVPPRIPLSEADIQPWLDRRRPGQSRFTTQRRESDQVKILSGLFEGQTTGTPVSMEPPKPSQYMNAKNQRQAGLLASSLPVSLLRNPVSWPDRRLFALDTAPDDSLRGPPREGPGLQPGR